MTTLLSARGLRASYGAAQVLFDVSLDVGAGEVVTLLGRNGMGRSTTVKCVFGLLRPGGGEIHVGGQRCDGWTSHRIARLGLGLVPEGRQIFPNLTVQENLTATARRASSPSSQAEPWGLKRIYELFPRLEERRSNLGNQLSGGEQQMLAIGRALMTNPRVLVLDEATEGLSPLVRGEIWKALANLRRDGLAMVVIDKNIRALLELADRHYVLEKGRVVWSGSSRDLRASPETVGRYLGV
ncbi:ABC transporter ATP-binding protein [Variovorax sp. YR216]|uniref:ABC transporter ATP-binding protein n=1 Tax=Variovorax sp. YR216 TaxID=1882828 RepID=UPI0008989999|nr:ABC transporter ATP-binding protein [Variovorax sp. YR216]SEA86523.1 amino acid/amide ABC transporter ATP-binding protein 2, HAAT family [Variovorax sp. YR216]